MNSADLLNALPGVTVLETVHSDLQSLPVWAIALVGMSFGALFFSLIMSANSESILCCIASISLALVAVVSSFYLVKQLMTLNWKEKYVVEIADDAPLSSVMVIFQDFKTVEVDGNTYTLIENN